ncbi:MAG: Gfo/Idh/MocA family protein [Kiloniellales bacterium]
MAKRGLGVGLIGSGYMGKCHALAWNAVASVFGARERPRLELLAEAEPALAERRAAELGFTRATANWRALVADPAVQVISITTPNRFHAEMAVAALEAGKHVWCEKPMAPSLAEAEAMLAAARRAGRVALLGYNYIQSPAIRAIAELLKAGAIGQVNHLRIEMDEDFMADPAAPFHWKSEASSGLGALDDFGVHPLSLIRTLCDAPVRAVFGEQAKPYPTRPTVAGGAPRAVETFDVATALLRLADGTAATLQLNRSAWGRKGRLFLQVFGSRGALVFDQERMNEFQLYEADGPAATRGFRTVLIGPQHPPYERFLPAPGHGLGFNDLKIIECRELLRLIAGQPALAITFEEGIAIERTVHAIARSCASGTWIEVADDGRPASPALTDGMPGR